MDVDERLRSIAEQVPAPPPGDASATFRRGIRRRRRRQVGGAAAALVIVGALGIGAASLIDRPAPLDIADQPPASTSASDDDHTAGQGDRPVIAHPPAMTISSSDPFVWSVALSATEDGRWCTTAVRGHLEVDDTVGQPCDQPLNLPEAGELIWHGSDPDRWPSATDQGLSWGLAPADAHTVLVGFTDDSHREALLATNEDVGAVLWAIAYEGVDVQLIESSGDHTTIGTAVLERAGIGLLRLVFGLLVLVALLVVATWFVRRRRP